MGFFQLFNFLSSIRVKDKVSLYGIIECQDNQLEVSEFSTIVSMIEKTKREETTSNLAAVGRYIFNNKILSILEKVDPDQTGEIQLTDAIKQLIEQEHVDAFCMKGVFHDCGDKVGYAKANIAYALQDSNMKVQISQYLKEIVELN